MTELKSHYEKPAEMYDGLRLHQNENTDGCSPRVLEALARLLDCMGRKGLRSEALHTVLRKREK